MSLQKVNRKLHVNLGYKEDERQRKVGQDLRMSCSIFFLYV